MTSFRLGITATLILAYALGVGPALAQDDLEFERVYDGVPLEHPLDLDAGPDGHVYVTQQSGQVVRFSDSDNPDDREVLLDLSDQVLYDFDEYTEAGLLALALHPEFDQNRRFFVYYVTREEASDGTDTLKTVLSEFEVSESNPDQAPLGSEKRILEVVQPTAWHNGGGLAFGPDGNLFLTLGEGSRGGDTFDHAQDRSTLPGSVLRIDVDDPAPGKAYGIPDSNPYVGNDEGFREEIYAYGLRNPYQLSIDHETGRIWVGDVGEYDFEEINLIEKGGNYGWPILEGRHCFPPSEEQDCDRSGFVEPVHVYRHDGQTVGRCVTGGLVYRGDRLPDLQGDYIFGDYISGRLWALDYDASGDTTVTSIDIPTEQRKNPVAFGLNTSGELHFVSVFHGIFRFVNVSGTGTEDEQEIAGDTELEVRGPNPAESGTLVTFRVGRSGPVRLTLFDLLGREVAVLVDEHVSAGRQNRVRIPTENLAAGTYLVRMQTGGVQRTRTIHVVR